jgi:hypothetical protein
LTARLRARVSTGKAVVSLIDGVRQNSSVAG